MGTFAFRSAKKGSHIFASTNHDTGFEDASWVFLLNPLSEYADDIFIPFPETNQTFKNLLIHFNDLKRVPPTEQSAFYNKYLEPTIAELCRGSFLADSVECDTGHLISQMYKGTTGQSTDSALPFLKFQKDFDQIKEPTALVKFLEERESLAKPGSFALQAIKTAHARVEMRLSNFDKAVELLKLEVNGTTGILQDEMKRSLCQSRALDKCETASIKACNGEDLWDEWSKGCKMSSAPKSNQDVTAFLGYWWNQAITREKIDFDKWEKSKPTVEAINALPVSQVRFDTLAKDTLDFVLSVKAEVPKELIERAAKISPQSPLWIWAQKKALKEFGPQWAALMPSNEQKLIAYLNLIPKYSERDVASDEK